VVGGSSGRRISLRHAPIVGFAISGCGYEF